MDDFIAQVKKDFPELAFTPGRRCFWSPKAQTVCYNPKNTKPSGLWSVLHEVGHAVLGHSGYKSDLELLMLEVAAWEKARELSAKYSIAIDSDHIQNCLDTYREWLHRRSTCPVCSSGSMQQSPDCYKCFNCQTSWHVSSARFCRPYRKITDQKEKPSEVIKPQTTFS